MIHIGDEVRIKGEDDSEVAKDSGGQKILDIAYMDMTFKPATALTEGARLMFLLKDYGWVPAEDCEANDDTFFEQDDRSPHLIDLGYNMVGWMDGLPDRPDNSKLPPVVTLLMAIQYDKEGSYGSSWKGKGEYRGIMANIDRKYDRLDNMTQDEIIGKIKTLRQLENELEHLKNNTGSTLWSEIGESKIDAIADLTNYGLLYMTYVREHFPKLFQVWVNKNVPKYLHDKIPFV